MRSTSRRRNKRGELTLKLTFFQNESAWRRTCLKDDGENGDDRLGALVRMIGQRGGWVVQVHPGTLTTFLVDVRV